MSIVCVASRTLVRNKVWCARIGSVLYCTSGESKEKSLQEKETPSQQPKPVVPPVPDITTYKVPEYYKHKEFSFYDIDTDMSKHRLKQPSSLTA